MFILLSTFEGFHRGAGKHSVFTKSQEDVGPPSVPQRMGVPCLHVCELLS